MKFTSTKENLLDGLQTVAHVAGKNIQLPILNNVLIEVQDKQVRLASTNLEIAATNAIRAKVEEEGSFTVPARTFLETVQYISGEKIECTTSENELIISSEHTKTKIKGSPGEEFPVIPAVEKKNVYTIEASAFGKGLSRVLFAASRSEVRPELGGVLFHFHPNAAEGILILAATDSYRLAEQRLLVEKKQGSNETTSLRVIVPARAVQEVSRILSTLENPMSGTPVIVEIVISENQIAFFMDGVEFTSRLVEGNYPDYTQIIPTTFKTTLTVSVAEFAKHIKAASVFTTTGVNAVSFRLDGGNGMMYIASASTQTGEYTSSLTAEVQGEDNTILLNHRYILDGLGVLGTADTTFQVIGPESPCLLRSVGEDTFRYVMMPIKQ